MLLFIVVAAFDNAEMLQFTVSEPLTTQTCCYLQYLQPLTTQKCCYLQYLQPLETQTCCYLQYLQPLKTQKCCCLQYLPSQAEPHLKKKQARATPFKTKTPPPVVSLQVPGPDEAATCRSPSQTFVILTDAVLSRVSQNMQKPSLSGEAMQALSR